jgi:hypothetical protein
MSTLVTERRRPPDDDAGQESLFGGEAFAAGAPAPTSWEREHAAPVQRRRATPPEASAHMPLDVEAPAAPRDSEAFGARERRADELGDAGTPAVETPASFEADVTARFEEERAPFDESQYLTGYEAGPSAADLAAYDFEVGTAPTEVPAHDAGSELAELERATAAPAAEPRPRPRAPLTGPTLDDVMSRAWGGLMTGLPAACPVCDGEVRPSFAGVVRGTCSSCGTAIE